MIKAFTQRSWQKAQNLIKVAKLFVVLNISKLFYAIRPLFFGLSNYFSKVLPVKP